MSMFDALNFKAIRRIEVKRKRTVNVLSQPIDVGFHHDNSGTRGIDILDPNYDFNMEEQSINEPSEDKGFDSRGAKTNDLEMDDMKETMKALRRNIDKESTNSPDKVEIKVTKTIQHTEEFGESDEDAETIYRVARAILDENMKGLSMDKNYGANVESIGALCAEFAEAMRDREKYRYLLTNRGGNAQKLVNILQMLLDFPDLEPSLKSGLLKALIRVSTRASVFPTCLNIHDIQFEKDPISDGCLSQIWRGTTQNHTVALKVIKIYRDKDINNLLKSLWREGIIWAHLLHPNVVPFYGIYHLKNIDEQVCLVSPWMNQGNIIDYLSRNAQVDRVKLVFEVAQGMEYLHANNVIHGDLKGANVLITDDGRAALCDFGLSTVSVDFDIMAYTSIETIPNSSGTLRYQAPELQFSDEDGTEPKLTKESDSYSYSCLCYEVFTNKIPFHEILFDVEVIFQVHSGRRPSRPPSGHPSWNNWGLMEQMWGLIEDCWGHVPSSRPSFTDIIRTIRLIVGKSDDVSTKSEGEGISSSAAFRRPLYDIMDMSTTKLEISEAKEDRKFEDDMLSRPLVYKSGIPVWRARSIITLKSAPETGSLYTDPSINYNAYSSRGSRQRGGSRGQKASSMISTAISTLSEDTFYANKFHTIEPCRVLLLGISQTGKSTIIKQLITAYGTGFSVSERESMWHVAFLTFRKAIQAVLDYMDERSIECSTQTAKQIFYTMYTLDPNGLGHAQLCGNYFADGRSYVRSAVKFLEDPIVAGILTSNWARFCLNSSHHYFLNKAQQLQNEHYMLTDEDIVHAHSYPTTGIWETKINMRTSHIRLYDVGGTRAERRKWIHHFQSKTCVMFCIALDDYCKVLSEDNWYTNRMEESISLFESVHSSRWFSGKPTILLLNKFDAFKEILQKIPLKDPAYKGGGDVSKALCFILEKYRAKVAWVQKPVYPHLLQATDRRNIKQVFRTVQNEILTTALESYVAGIRKSTRKWSILGRVKEGDEGSLL